MTRNTFLKLMLMTQGKMLNKDPGILSDPVKYVSCLLDQFNKGQKLWRFPTMLLNELTEIEKRHKYDRNSCVKHVKQNACSKGNVQADDKLAMKNF